MRWTTLLLGLWLGFATGSAAAGDELGVADKARLQAAMRQHIEQQLIDGALLHLDFTTGEVVPLYPSRAHPMIFAMGEYFVLCTDLAARDGSRLPLDLYLATNGQRYTVFRAEVANRKPLQQLMWDGIVRRIP